MRDRLDDLLAAGVADGAAAGVSAVVVDRDGVRYEGAFGVREAGTDVAMTTDTVGAIFSMTKAITGAAAMQLVEQGRLDLDAPAADACPDPRGASGARRLRQRGPAKVARARNTAITLRHLLTHTSGLAYDIWDADLTRWYEVTEAPSLFSGLKAALATPLVFDPGTRWEYGIGIDWAGQMVEAVTGQTLGQYFAESLTGPLGMHDTAFVHNDAMAAKAAGMHARTPDGELVPMELPRADNPEFEMGGGGLQSTMPDYGRFLRMILNDGDLDGTRVLDAATVEQMATNQIG